MGSQRPGFLTVLLVGVLLSSCEASDPSLWVDVKTDLTPSVEFDAIEVRPLIVGEAVARVPADLERGGWRIGRRVGQWTLPAGDIALIATATLRGVTVVEREAIVALRGDTISTLVLSRECAGVRCPDASNAAAVACLGGRCVPPECVTGNEPACGPPQCDTDDECPEMICGVPLCQDGTCFSFPDERMCAVDERCVPGEGCQAIETGPPMDAHIDAPMDTSPVDAGTDAQDAGDDSGMPPRQVWVEDALLKTPSPSPEDWAGHVVALSRDGDTVAVGLPGEGGSAAGIDGMPDDTLPGAGAVTLWIRGPDGWATTYIKASDPTAHARFGSAVALSSDGRRLAVGAIGDPDGTLTGTATDLPGTVYLFERSGESWRQLTQLTASNAGANDAFGAALSFDATGRLLAIGAPLEDSPNDDSPMADTAVDAGAAYLFRQGAEGDTWREEAFIKAFNADPGDRFGVAVAVDGAGRLLAVGAPEESSLSDPLDNLRDRAGAVYLYSHAGADWTQRAFLKAESGRRTGDLFGHALDFAEGGERLAIGAHREATGPVGVDGPPDLSAEGAGAAYVYLRRADDDWIQEGFLKTTNADGMDNLAISLSLTNDGTRLAVGARRESSGDADDPEDDSAYRAGAAYVFEFGGGRWWEVAYVKASNVGARDGFGTSIAIAGDRMVIGAPFEDSPSAAEPDRNDVSASGAVYSFHLAGR